MGVGVGVGGWGGRMIGWSEWVARMGGVEWVGMWVVRWVSVLEATKTSFAKMGPVGFEPVCLPRCWLNSQSCVFSPKFFFF